MGTHVEEGRIPIRYGPRTSDGKLGPVELYSTPRETKEFGGKKYLMEESIRGDFALIKAWKGDELGNLMFRYVSATP